MSEGHNQNTLGNTQNTEFSIQNVKDEVWKEQKSHKFTDSEFVAFFIYKNNYQFKLETARISVGFSIAIFSALPTG